MVNEDRKAFADIMSGLAENFGTQLTTAGIRLRYEALKSFDLEQVKQAAISIVASRKYTSMPTVADFLEHLGGGSVDDRAYLEASKVWNAIKAHGGWKSVCFDDPTTQAVIFHGFGGWIKLCSELMECEMKHFLRDFIKMYGAFSRQGVKVTGALTGRGFGETKLIGDPIKAQLVLEQANTQQINTQPTCTLIAGLLTHVSSEEN